MAMEKEEPKLRVVMFPWLAHGHISPFLQLSKKLSTKNFVIYLCSTAANLHSIRSSIDDGASIKLVEFQIPPTSQLPPEMHTTRNLPSNLIPTLIQDFQISSSNLSDILDSVKPDLLIYDFFAPWAPKIASTKGIPSVFFSTAGAACGAFHHHVHTMGSPSTFPYKAISVPGEKEKEKEKEDKNKFKIEHFVKDADDHEFAFGLVTRSTDIILVKSCKGFEGKYIDYLSALCKKRILCTGPLIADVNHHDDTNIEIMNWLNRKSDGSMVYISLGSECFLSREQIREIAKGLLLCGVNFLWVIRFSIGEEVRRVEEELPEGFLETVKEKGLVVSRWAPQTKILAHPSIGAFVSHCGWSSLTESLYYGIPVVAMPMHSEQPINAQLVVESGAGVEVGIDGNGVYVGEEVAKTINKVMGEKTVYEDVRDRARKLSKVMREKEDEEMDELAEQLWQICMKNKIQQ